MTDDRELRTLRGRVEHCLREYPETRNSDITLTIKIWQEFNGVKGGSIYLEQLYDLPREDNIKRIRAKIQSEGRYLPTIWDVAEQRGINRQVWEHYLGYDRAAKNASQLNLFNPYVYG